MSTKQKGDAGGPSDRALPEPAPSQEDSPSHDEIARRAFELHLERGGGEGGAEEDWLRAEDELRRKNAAAASDRGGRP